MTSESLKAVQAVLVGQYVAERELGRGGMGAVYLAREVRLDRQVAVKVLPQHLGANPELRERFLREARTSAQLSHPHIVPIFRADEMDGLAFFTMAYIDGENLAERLSARGPLPAAEAVRVLRETAWALAYAHARGVIHRDIKPENFMVERGSNRAIVTDFGYLRRQSPMPNRAHRLPLKFFALVLGLSIPFWLLGAATDVQLMPGLSVSVLMAFCPAVAAMILVHRENSAEGVAALLRRSLDFQRIKTKRWYVPILLLMPCISIVVYGLMLWQGMPLPAPHVSVVTAMLMFLAFFIGALGEELGWSGYAIDPIQNRWSACEAGVIFGLVAIIWHLVPLIQLHRSPTWIAWWCLYAVAARVLIVWLYNNTAGSVFAVAVFHATLNLAYMMFPINGSYFDMRYGGLVTAFAAAVITIVWGPLTLTRHARARSIT